VSNDEVYAAGLLNRALDPDTQPAAIQAFLRAEFDILHDTITKRSRLIDFGCGTGRHLLALSDCISLGIGLDYEYEYIAEARRRSSSRHLHFITSDATAVPVMEAFDFATCLTNTWGTMSNKAGVLAEMRRLAPTPGTRILSVYSSASVPARREWYHRLGHTVAQETNECLITEGGFRSEHFSESHLRSLIGTCTLQPLTKIGYLVTF